MDRLTVWWMGWCRRCASWRVSGVIVVGGSGLGLVSCVGDLGVCFVSLFGGILACVSARFGGGGMPSRFCAGGVRCDSWQSVRDDTPLSEVHILRLSRSQVSSGA